MRPDDAAVVDELARSIWGGESAEPPQATRARGLARIRHLVETDPGGAWVAEAGGALAGAALALVRDGIWGLSLLIVAPDQQRRGAGLRLLEATLAHAAGTRGGMIVSSEHPGAMRSYVRAGFTLHPCVSAAGVVVQERIPADVGRVVDAGHDGIAAADAIGRAVRGAGHGRDLPVALDHGARLLLLDDRAFAVTAVAGTKVYLLGARDEQAARTVLWAALASAGPGATVDVDVLTAHQQWAIETCLDAGLAFSPAGPLFVRGALGPLAPYLPSGAFL
jgi:GNAT superfamily N-acetyltransferase